MVEMSSSKTGDAGHAVLDVIPAAVTDQAANFDGKVDIAGDAKLGGKLEVTVGDVFVTAGSLTTGDNLTVGDDAFVTDTLVVSSTIITGGDITSTTGKISASDDLVAFDDLFVSDDGSIGGDFHVVGTLSKGSGTFKIDHPLDPENQYLYHSFVESPDMMNIYNGNVETDEKGYATVELPHYFEVLNIDFRYQLTVIGSFAQAIVKEEVVENAFVIQTNEPNTKVSWQVTGVRNDDYARENRVQVEVEKEAEAKGTRLYTPIHP